MNLNLSIYSRLGDLLNTGKEFSISLDVLSKDDSEIYISKVFNTFRPFRTWGHVQIGKGKSLTPSEKFQYIYSIFIENNPLFIIFEQNHKEDKNFVLKVKNGKDLARLVYENGGLEYFLSDTDNTFLIAVNRYSIEYIGEISFDFEMLNKFQENTDLEDFWNNKP